LKEELNQIHKEQEYNSFLYEELALAQLKAGELAELESEYEQLNNVEFIRENLVKSLAMLNDEQFGILLQLHEMKTALQKTAGFSADYQLLSERAGSVAIELKDLSDEILLLSGKLNQDPAQLERINDKLQKIYGLLKKHQVQTVEELLVIEVQLEKKVTSVAALESEIATFESQLLSSASKLDILAVEIHKKRNDAIPILTQKWSNILAELGMPNVRFKIDLKKSDNYFANGKDVLEFMFSANKGSDFGLLKKVASGGEMSRIMLATKSILAEYSNLPTIIFDEIDTGVSGEIANKMGEIMKEMSHRMQVFAITHLPQIAAKGNIHFKVFKLVKDNATQTEIKVLDVEERVLEIAQMLSGTTISDSALNHAKALLD